MELEPGWAGPWTAVEGLGGPAQEPSPCWVPWSPLGRGGVGEGPGRGAWGADRDLSEPGAGTLATTCSVPSRCTRPRCGVLVRTGPGVLERVPWASARGREPPASAALLSAGGIWGFLAVSTPPLPHPDLLLFAPPFFCPVSWWCPPSFSGNKLGLEGITELFPKKCLEAPRFCHENLMMVQTSQPFMLLRTRIPGWREVI